MNVPKCILVALTIFSLAACGGSSGGDEGVSVRADLTEPGPFRAGESVPYVLTTENFTLAAPFNMRSAVVARHDAPNHGEGDMAMNPNAKEGHYHVYLNDGSGTDPHVTAWSSEGSYQLPDTLEAGTHSLRFELRDNNHVMVGVETVLFFDVE